jgi:hypothetical protein
LKTDKLGRTFYSECSEEIRFVCEGLRALSPNEVGTPRKILLPMLGVVRSSMTTPFVRGELVLIVLSRTLNEDLNNEVGYFEDSNTAIGVYRVINKSLIRV